MIAVGGPWAIVGREKNESAVVEAEPLQCLAELANRPVELLDHVAIESRDAFPAEFRRGEDRHMRHHVRQIEEEWPIAVTLDESERAFGETTRERGLIRVGLDYRFVVEQRQRRQAG